MGLLPRLYVTILIQSDSWFPDEDRRHPFPGRVYALGVSFVGLGLTLVNQVHCGLG